MRFLRSTTHRQVRQCELSQMPMRYATLSIVAIAFVIYASVFLPIGIRVFFNILPFTMTPFFIVAGLALWWRTRFGQAMLQSSVIAHGIWFGYLYFLAYERMGVTLGSSEAYDIYLYLWLGFFVNLALAFVVPLWLVGLGWELWQRMKNKKLSPATLEND